MKHVLSSFIPSFFRPTADGGAVAPAEGRSKKYEARSSERSGMDGWLRKVAVAAIAAGAWLGGAGEAWAQGATWIGNSFLVVNGTWYNGSGSGNTARPDSFGNLSSIELGAEIQSYGDSDGAGNPATMIYKIDNGSWSGAIDMTWYKYANNNNFFHVSPVTVDIRSLGTGSHHLYVKFYKLSSNGTKYDNNAAEDFCYDLSFTKVTTSTASSITLTGSDSNVRVWVGKTDHIDRKLAGVDAIAAWAQKKPAGGSGAIFNGKTGVGSATATYKSMTLGNSNREIWTLKSGGLARRVRVTWNSGTSTANSRQIEVWGKNVPYAAGDMFDTNLRGTSLGTMTPSPGNTTELVITGNYKFIGLRASNASYAHNLDAVEIDWEEVGLASTSLPVTLSGLEPDTEYTWGVASGSSLVASGRASTLHGTAPALSVTGVDTTSYLLHWTTPEGSGNKGYYAQTGTSSEFSPERDGSDIDTDLRGWVLDDSSAKNLSAAYDSHSYTFNNARVYNGGTQGNEIYLTTGGSHLITEPIKGRVKRITYALRAGGSGSLSSRTVTLGYNNNGGDTFTTLETKYAATSTAHTVFTCTPSTPLDGGTSGIRFRWHVNNNYTVLIGSIKIELDTDEGHSAAKTGSNGTTYYGRVRKSGEGIWGVQSDWSSTLSWTLGVLPSSLGNTDVSSDSASFGWTGHAGATAGYEVQWTTNSSTAWSDISCDTGSDLGLNEVLDGQTWCYIGQPARSTTGDVKTAPCYVTDRGHMLIGQSGNGILSPAVDLRGATGVTLSYSVGSWNLGNGLGLEAGRVNAYYQIDDGPWNYLGTGVPGGTSLGNLNAMNFAVPVGGLEGDSIRFKLVAINAETFSDYLRGPYISALKIKRTASGLGDYADGGSATVGSGTTSYTVEDLPSDSDVFFRVRALQSGGAVKSKWVEVAEAAHTTPPQSVAFDPVPTAVAAGESLALTAAAAYENAAITYSIQPGGTGSAHLEVSGGVTNLVGDAAGTVMVRATAGATAHYAAGTYADAEVLVRPARPTTQATLLAADNRTTDGFRLNYHRGGTANASGATTKSGVLILVKANSAPTGPTDGVGVKNIGTSDMAWSGGATLGDATAMVNSTAGGADDLQHKTITSGASPGTHYFAAAYAYNATGTLNAANQTYSYMTPAATTDFWTLAAEPGTAATVSGAKAAVDGDTHAVVTYNAQGAGNILLVMMKDAEKAPPPVADGVCYTNVASTNYGTVAAALGNGYIVYAGPAAAGSQTVAVAGLSGGTSYVVYAFPYNTAAGDDGGTSANYRAHTLSAAFETEAAQGPEELDAETTRYTMSVSWKAMTPPAGKTVTGYTVEATACGGDGVLTTNSCPDDDLTGGYDPTKAAHGSTDGWSYRWSVKSASDNTHSYPDWWTTPGGHMLQGRWTSTTYKPGIESPVIDLSGAASAKVVFQMRAYESKNGYTSTYANRSPVTLYWSTNGGTTWTNGPKTGNGGASFAAMELAVPPEALAPEAKLQLRADSAAGYSIVADGTTNYYSAGSAIKGIAVVQTAPATGDYSGSGCPVPAANISVSGTNATVTGLSSNQLYYYRVKANYSDSTSSKWSEETATTKGTMAAPGAGASAERYAGTIAWTAPEGESANVTGWTVEVTGCTGEAADEPATNACPDAALSYTTGANAVEAHDEDWIYCNRDGGYPSRQNWGGYNGGAHFLVGTGGSASSPTPKGIISPRLDLSTAGSAFVRFMHAPNLQSPISNSYVTLYYSLDGTSWTKAETLKDAGQVWKDGPSLVYKELKIDIPDAALADGVHLKLSTDNAWQQVTATATNQFGARLAEIRVVATPLRQDWDWSCAGTMTSNYTSSSGGWSATGMSQRFGVLSNATTYGYRVRATDEGGNASETVCGQFTTLAGQDPPLQIWAEPVKQTQMKLQWDAAEDATGYAIQMTKCHETPWERVVATACPTNRRLGAEDDWSYIGGGTDVDKAYAADGTTKIKESETNYITAGGFYPTWADGGSPAENSQVLAGEGDPGIMSAAFSTVGATNGVLIFNYGRWYANDNLKNVTEDERRNASVLSVFYSTDDGATWEDWFKTPSAYAYAYTYRGTYGQVTNSLPAAALGKESVRVKIVAENACIMDVSTKAGSSYVTNHAVGAAVALAEVKLQGVSGDYSGAGCRVDDGTWTVSASAEELSFLVTNLTANTPYYFRVRATDGETVPEQYGTWTDGAAATLAAPDRVTNLTASAVGRYGFTLGWDASARAESYTAYVYRNSDNGLVGTYPADGLSVRVTNLVANTAYYCKVTAWADDVLWDGTPAPDTTSTNFPIRTANAISITALEASGINTNSMTVSWEGAGSGGSAQNILTWGEVGSDEGLGAVEEVIACPASTLGRSDSGNRWFYMGGSASYPAYWKGSASGDEGHALIYNYGGAPGIRSRWFDTWGATNVVVEFLHGRFNSGADATVELDYSIDGGATWTYAGEAPSTTSSKPVVARSLALPKSALNRKSVMIQLSAPGADGNKGAHLKDIQIRIQGRMLSTGGGEKTWTGAATSATSWTLSGLTPGKRYWFKLRATDDGTTWVEATNSASTYAETAGVLASQGFEDATTDRTPWSFTLSTNKVSDGTAATGSGCPVVEVVENENPLYGRRALRMSGSANAAAFGVVDFTFALGNRGGVVTIPFAAKDLAKNDYLYVACKVGSGSWTAPGGTDQTSMGGIPLTRIGCGGSDVINQNWPYNRVLNATTRPKGDAYSFEVPAGSAGDELTVRVAFCGQSGGAKRYYYIDEVTLEEAAGVPAPATATANDHGTIDLTWTAPSGQSVVIIRGQDKREPPSPGAPDLTSLPEGYEIVMNGDSWYWNRSGGTGTGDGTTVSSTEDTGATSGWKYFYYFYAVTDSGTIGKTPATAYAIVRGMVKAIASQGWDDWDVHPWSYRQGRVSNPGAKSDCGWWKANGMNSSNVKFYEDAGESDSDGISRPLCGQTGSGFGTAPTYASIYGTGKKYGPATGTDPDATKQQGVSTYTNYYGEHSYRFSGGGGYVWQGEHSYSDWNNNWVTATNPVINTNNAAVEFANVDLTGYKNVEFQMHYAGPLQGGGNYLHLAISTNGGAAGSWQAVDNLNSAGWRVRTQAQDYGLQVQEMYSGLTSTNVDFYDQTLAQYGNPFILEVPDNVTQFMARVMFYDSNGRTAGYWRNAAIFIDEVRLLGEVALETPKPFIDNIASNSFRVAWTNVPDADRYNLRVTSVESNEAVKLAESFAVQGTLDWTAGGSVSYTYDANRQGGTGSLGYGLVLDANDESLTSPAIGCAETLSFWASGASDTTAELSVQIGSGTAWETLWSATVSQIRAHAGAAESDGNWSRYEISLPHRQWQQIRFVKTAGSGQAWVDDIQVLGAGNYATTVFTQNGLTDTNCAVTGLANGTRYFVSVQAVEDVSDGGETYEIKSPWGETADYTAGIFTAEADGFEMMRLGWGNPGNGIVVVAVTNGNASAVATPAKDAALAVGTQVVAGSAVVVASDTESADGFEHVWPYKGNGAAAQYVVFWKHGGYWEGRLETNVATGVYVCDAADAMAYTNGWMMSAATAQAPLDGGKGWDGPWTVVRKQWDDAGSVTKNASGTEGLLETNQLWGAGGNMLVLYPGSDNQSYAQEVYVKRKLATALSADQDWWGMFAMKISNVDSPAWAGIDLLAGETSQASIGMLWNDAKAGISDQYSTYGIDAGHAYVYVFKWDKASKTLYLHVEYVSSSSSPQWDPSVAADLTAPNTWTWHKSKTISSLSDITHIQLSTKSDANKHLGNVYFDEIRIGPDWPSLIGKQELPPLPAYDVIAVPDGNEMVRLSWKYKPGGQNADGSENPLMEHANGVTVIETTDPDGVTAEETEALRDAAPGATFGNATVIASHAVAAAAEAEEMDHVVLPGTTHRYAVVTRNGGACAVAAQSAAVEMGTYGEREWANPFSYTNAVEFSVAYPSDWATRYNGVWKGGHGFESGQGFHYWAKMEDGGTWTPVKPSVADATVHITNAIANYWPSAGNAMLWEDSADNQSGTLQRSLNNAWCGNEGDDFYVAFRMAYKWDGKAKWAGLRLVGGNTNIFFGKVAGSDNGTDLVDCAGIAATPYAGGRESAAHGAAGSLDDYGNSSNPDNAYLVVGKVHWTAAGKVNAYVWAAKTGAGGASLPTTEPEWTIHYDNAKLDKVYGIALSAGTSSALGGGRVGAAYFDEIRFGTTWDDIVGPADPTDVRMALVDGNDPQTTATTAWKGDFVSFDFESTPDGKKQTAAGWLTWDAGTTWTEAAVATNIGTNTGWVQWRATNVQLTAAGTVRAGGSVAGSSVTMESWERTENARRYRAYTVRGLNPPTDIHAEGGVLRNLFDWTQWTDSPRTFEQVMVVRFDNTADRDNWTPVDGTAYAQGVTYNGGKVVYVGIDTNCVDTGLARNQEYWYAFYTVNNDYYSLAAAAECTTLDEDVNVPDIDGDPTDWVGVPSVVKNSSTVSANEFIWTDKIGEERKDTDACQSADLKEFRVKADATDVYFLVRLSGGEATAATNAYAAVALTTSGLADGNADGEKWIGAPGNTLMGGAYWQTNASLHHADREMAVHYVAGAEKPWQVEIWDKNGGHWYAATNWAAAGSAAGAADACIEWRVPRDTLGLDYAGSYCMTGRFTVATFVNSGSWNNQAAGTAQIGDNGKSRAVDAMAIAPYGQDDKDLSLGAWEEGLREKEVPFWADVRFDSGGVHLNEAPRAPTGGTPNGESQASPTMAWTASSDRDNQHYEGFVTGYFLEVATNATYNGVGDGTENGSIAYRVNLGVDTTSRRFVTDGAEYWWRVRARDNSGELSAPGEWHYVVTGKKDNAGPVAKLLYVGTNVMQFLGDPAYRADEERSGDATSVLDSELEDGGHNFGFVIEWTDSSGVYAMNKMRGWDAEHDRPGSWPDNKPVGSFAWNIYATHGDDPEKPYGRVSPNWDLLIVDRYSTSRPDPETVDGVPHYYSETRTVKTLPTEDGGTEDVLCYFIDCGKDAAFQYEELYPVGKVSNGGTVLTNFVTNAFSLSTYRPGIELYLTVSAEDCCTTGTTAEDTGDAGWWGWPWWNGDDPGSYKGLYKSEQSASLSGWCQDGPHKARNVTTNQLLKFYVRDNDVIPPVASTEKWKDAKNADGDNFYPFMAAACGTRLTVPDNWQATWTNLTNSTLTLGLLPVVEGIGRSATYQLTDADLAAGGKLRFFFNVYDEYIHSGVKRSNDTTSVVRKVINGANVDRTLTNSAFFARTWDATAAEGAGAWVDGTPNRANFASNWSKVYDMTENGDHEFVETAGTEGTGPSTVLAWEFDASVGIAESLFARENLLDYIGHHSDGVTSKLVLDAWDSDNNGVGDQAHDDLEFGRLLFTDDDATPPESPGFNLMGTGTNFVQFGALAGWAYNASGATAVNYTTNKAMKGIEATGLTGEYYDKDKAKQSASLKNDKYLTLGYGMKTNAVSFGTNAFFQFDVQGQYGAEWKADTLSYEQRVSADGPTNFILTVMEPDGYAEHMAVSGGVVDENWELSGNTQFEKASGLYRFRMTGKGGTETAGLLSTDVDTSDSMVAKVLYRVGWYGTRTNSDGSAVGGTLTVKNGAGTAIATYTASSFAGTAASGCWIDAELPIRTGQSGERVMWNAAGLTGGSGFVVRDAKLVTQTGFGVEQALMATPFTVEKDLDDDGDTKITTTPVCIQWNATPVQNGGVRRYRLYGWGATAVNGSWGVNDVAIYGISSLPKGFEVTDEDLLHGSWTNALEIIDGDPTGYDTRKSGICVTNGTGAYDGGIGPQYTLYYPLGYTNDAGSAVSVLTGPYDLLGLTEAQYTRMSETNFLGGWTLAGGAEAFPTNKARVGTHVLRFPEGSTDASATTNLALAFDSIGESKISGATVSGNLYLRALSTTGDNLDNTLTVTLSLLDGSGREVTSSVQTLTAAHMAWWDEVTLAPLSMESMNVRTAKVAIARSADGTASEVFVDDLSVTVALWGEESGNLAPEEMRAKNGVEGAKFRLKTETLGAEDKTMPLSASVEGEAKAYQLVSTVYDYDCDRADDALSVTATNEFTLYDDDEVAPQTGSMYGGPLGVSLGGTLLPKTARSGSGTNLAWTVTDHALRTMAQDGTVELALNFYDYSGWNTKDLAVGDKAVQADGSAVAANHYAQTASIGAENVPGALNTWTITAGNLYALHADAFATADGATNLVTGIIADRDHDRKDDSMSVTTQVGKVWFTDQDVLAPQYASQTNGYCGIVVSTNVPDTADGYKAITNKSTANPYALGGDADEHKTSTPSTRSFLVYDGDLGAAAEEGRKRFVVTANLNDPKGSGVGRSSSGLQVSGTGALAATNTVWGDTVVATNSYVAWETAAAGSARQGVLTNAVWNETLSAAVGNTKVTTGNGHLSWSWDAFSREDVGILLPAEYGTTENPSRGLHLNVYAFDADADRPGDQAMAALAGPEIVVRDDDTTPPTAPGDVRVNGDLVDSTVTYNRDNAPWTNSLGGFSLSFGESADNAENGDPRASGVAGYWLAPATGDLATNATGVLEINGTTNGGTVTVSSLAGISIAEGLQTWRLFSSDADDDREGDSLASAAANVPIAYDATPPTSLSAAASWTDGTRTNTMTASSEANDVTDPTSEMYLDWTACGATMQPDVGTGSEKSGTDTKSPWKSYKIYMTTYEPTSDTASFSDTKVSGAIGKLNARDPNERDGAEGWTSVMGSDSKFSALTNSATGHILLTDLEPGENYIFAVVGVDKAGNESKYPVYALGDTIKFMVTQGVVRAWATVSNELNNTYFGAKAFSASNTAGTRGTPTLYWDAKINDTTHRANRGYSLVYRDGTVFEEGTNLTVTVGDETKHGWGRIAGNSISNNFYAEPDGNAQKLGEQDRGMMRFYRATYAGREFAEGGIVPLASEEVYALHNVKLTEGRNFVALHGVPYTNTFAGVFGTDTNYWPAGPMGNATRVEFFNGSLAFDTNMPASDSYWFQDGKWYTVVTENGNSTTQDVTSVEQTTDFFTRGFAITLPPRASGYYDSSEAQVRIVEKGANGFQTTNYVPVFNWSPILQMPTNDAAHQFTVTVKCGTNSVVPFGLTNFTKRTAVDTLVAFRAPVSVHPRQLGLPLVANTDTTTNGFTYNLTHPELGDRLLIMAAASKDARIRFDESECGNASHSLGSLSQMYYDGATEKWRWFDKGNSSDPEVTGWPIKPNDALVIRSCNGGTHTNWTWSYTPTNLYDAADRHFGY